MSTENEEGFVTLEVDLNIDLARKCAMVFAKEHFSPPTLDLFFNELEGAADDLEKLYYVIGHAVINEFIVRATNNLLIRERFENEGFPDLADLDLYDDNKTDSPDD